MIRFVGFILCTLLSLKCVAQKIETYNPCNSADSIHTNTAQRLQIIDFAIPAAMTAAGFALTYCDHKRHLNNGIQKITNGHKLKIDDYAQYVPIPVSIVLGSLGVPTQYNILDRSLMAFTSSFFMVGISRCIKHYTWERRPNDSGTNSFPSGHTATAFTGAELIRLEYGGPAAIAAYSFAAMVGFLRIYNNKHWINDVIGGAGIGILSARIGYWLLPYEKRLIRNIGNMFHRPESDKMKTSILVAPVFQNGFYGCSISIST